MTAGQVAKIFSTGVKKNYQEKAEETSFDEQLREWAEIEFGDEFFEEGLTGVKEKAILKESSTKKYHINHLIVKIKIYLMKKSTKNL